MIVVLRQYEIRHSTCIKHPRELRKIITNSDFYAQHTSKDLFLRMLICADRQHRQGEEGGGEKRFTASPPLIYNSEMYA